MSTFFFFLFLECSSVIDIVVVCDESNSIYPWDAVRAFLKKFVQGLDIGINKTQVSKMQPWDKDHGKEAVDFTSKFWQF